MKWRPNALPLHSGIDLFLFLYEITPLSGDDGETRVSEKACYYYVSREKSGSRTCSWARLSLKRGTSECVVRKQAFFGPEERRMRMSGRMPTSTGNENPKSGPFRVMEKWACVYSAASGHATGTMCSNGTYIALITFLNVSLCLVSEDSIMQ